ncbi:MAG: hypothetical protein R3B09_02270 [Nannocystaceae bacterium]
MRTSILLLPLFVPLLACGAAASQAYHAGDSDDFTSSSSSGGEGGSSWNGPISTLTTSPGETEGGGSTAGDTDGATSEADTSPEPAGPPSIANFSLTPEPPITVAGPITVKVWAADAEGVRMDLAGAVTELAMIEPGLFEGEILVVTGFDHGGVAVVTPWRGDDDGAALEIPYAVELPEPGGEALFDVDYESGLGVTAAIGVLQNGDAVELLTLPHNASTGCFLRRRGADGEILGELAVLVPDHCKAVDLEVHEGAMFALLVAETVQGPQWWVAKVPHWGAFHSVVTTGDDKEVARDLAVSSSGVVAVCGSAPTPEPDDLADAVVHIVRPDFSSHARNFDFSKDGLYHKRDEEASGCAFDPNDDSRLILVGSVFGYLDKQIVEKINRRFDVLYDVETDAGELRVADASLGATQSFATDVVFAGGQAFVVGVVCGSDVCDQVEARMWVLDSDGDLTSTRSLGLHSNKALGPSRIRVTPAGYLVLASGGIAGSDEAFVVRAFDPLKTDPLWTYSRQDGGLVHRAHALAIGPYGQVYAGGFGASGYPLFVTLYG